MIITSMRSSSPVVGSQWRGVTRLSKQPGNYSNYFQGFQAAWEFHVGHKYKKDYDYQDY